MIQTYNSHQHNTLYSYPTSTFLRGGARSYVRTVDNNIMIILSYLYPRSMIMKDSEIKFIR